jgi:D-arabinose 1-dehydrogenase-like Zn-dependent alcohol dehydrogenase
MFKAGVVLSPRNEAYPGLELQERSLQETIASLSPAAVLVRTRVAGVCHSDLHLWHGYYKVSKY